MVLRQPRHQERGVEAAGIGEQNGLRVGWLRHGDSQLRNNAFRRTMSRCCARASAVARKIVSSPDMVPTTSGHSALSSATATLGAAPIVVRITVIEAPAVRTVRTNCAEIAISARDFVGRHQVAAASLEHAELAQVAADR